MANQNVQTLNLDTQGGYAQQPNGEFWPILNIRFGLLSASFTIPPDQFRQWADEMPLLADGLLAECEDARIKSKLIVATELPRGHR
jgi:hypothetical protein